MTARKASHHDFDDAEKWMEGAFGSNMATYLRLGKRDPFGRAVRETATVLALGNVRTYLDGYWQEDHPSGRGRHALISITSALHLMFVTMRTTGTVSIQAASDLLMDANRRELELLQIHPDALDPDSNYDRVWRAVHRLKDTLDRFPGDRRWRPTREMLKAIHENHRSDPAKLLRLEERMNELCNQILQGTWLMLPKELRARMHGTIALDATLVPVSGHQQNLEKMSDEVTASANYDCGYYIREGNHDGTNASPKKRRFGWEAELATMTRNKPGADIDAPLFIVWFGGHKPGDIDGEGKKMLTSLIKRGIPIRTIIADRAYLPGSKAEDFQLPASAHGASLVMDYPITALGKQTHYTSVDGKHSLVMCDGSWYPAFMPITLQDAEKIWAQVKKAAKKVTNERTKERMLREGYELVTKRRAQRTKYRLIPRSRHKADGSRQYSYPTGLDTVDWDQTTGEEFAVSLPGKTVLVPGDLGKDNIKHLKYGQEFEYKSETWRAYYGLRNTIESVNSRVKDPQREGIHDPLNRRGRGPWFAEIAAALAAASQNLRRFIYFLQDRLGLKNVTAKNRNLWMTYAKASKSEHLSADETTAGDGSEPPEFYLRPIWEVFEE